MPAFEFKSQSKVLLPCELELAEEKVLKLSQQKTFPELYDEKQSFGKTSKGVILAKFSPFLVENGLIRIRGRIKHANLSFQQRHSILLSTKHSFVSVMLHDLHLGPNHEGVEYVRSVIQQNFGFRDYEML